jgi:hypothetical protein
LRAISNSLGVFYTPCFYTSNQLPFFDLISQAELLHEEQQRALENQVTVERSKPAKRPTHGVPVSTEKRAKLRNVGKENTQSRIKTTAKPKVI